MPKDRTLIIGGVIFVVLLILASIAGKLLSGREASTSEQLAGEQSVLAEIYTPTAGAPTDIAPTQTPVPENSGEWIFQKMQGTQASGILKGHDIGWFTSADGTNEITAVCSAPRSPAPKPGDIFIWDPQTNILYPKVDNAQGNIQRFWYPTHTGG